MWPAGARCAVAFTFDLDAESVWLAIDPANAERPAMLSMGRYGPRVAIPLILDLLAKHDVHATFFVPGQVAEEHPDTVRALVAAGHELGVHGYTHTHPSALTLAEEEDELTRAKEILESFGVDVVGYRAPAWDVSRHTLDLLAKHGFTYSSNFMDDVRPYRHAGRDVIELPIHWLLDDAVHFWFDNDSWDKKIATPSEVREIWEAEFEGIRELSGAFILTMHPQIIGRPHRLKFLDAFARFVRAHDDAWIATCAEIAEQVKPSLA